MVQPYRPQMTIYYVICNYIATGANSEYKIGYILLFHGNNGYANVLQSYVYVYSACLVNRM